MSIATFFHTLLRTVNDWIFFFYYGKKNGDEWHQEGEPQHKYY